LRNVSEIFFFDFDFFSSWTRFSRLVVVRFIISSRNSPRRLLARAMTLDDLPVAFDDERDPRERLSTASEGRRFAVESVFLVDAEEALSIEHRTERAGARRLPAADFCGKLLVKQEEELLASGMIETEQRTELKSS